MSTIYECIECQTRFNTSLNSVFTGKTNCPRCKASAGEKHVWSILKKLKESSKIKSFKHQLRHPGCYNEKILPFDFGVVGKNGTRFLIEFDGIQHFEKTYFGGYDNGHQLEYTQQNDGIKDVFSIIYEIPLLRIHYKDINNVEKNIKSFIDMIKIKPEYSIYYTESYL